MVCFTLIKLVAGIQKPLTKSFLYFIELHQLFTTLMSTLFLWLQRSIFLALKLINYSRKNLNFFFNL
jgi:hypothetical protein